MAFPKLYRENIGAGAVGVFAADTGAEGTATAFTDAPDNYGSLIRPAPIAAYPTLRFGTGTFSRTYSGFKPNALINAFFHFYHDNAGLNGQSVVISNSTSGNSATVTPLAGIAVIQPLVCQANGSGSVTFTIADGSSYWLLNALELFEQSNITRQIVCEGDSRVDSYGVASLDTFPAKLAALLGANYYRAGVELIYSAANKINVINIGTGNATSQDSLDEIPTQIEPLFDYRIQNDLVLHTGGNDEGHGLTQVQTLSNYHSYKSNVEAKGWNFYACTVSDGNAITSTLLPKMHELNADIRSTVPLSRVIDLALNANLNDYANLTYFQADGIHYTAAGNQIQAEIAEQILNPPPTLLLTRAGCELYLEPDLDTAYASGQDVTFLTDYSDHARNVSAASPYPVYSTPVLNGKAVVVWDGTKKPLKTPEIFTVACGFMVLKINEAGFSNYAGILTDTEYLPILVGNEGTNYFYDAQAELFEYRMSDRITSRDLKTGIFTPPAPMNAYRIMFFRFWKPVQVSGIQIGQDRKDTARKAKMSLALLALYSTGFCESDIRKSLEKLATAYGLTLEDVFPFYLDQDSTHRDVQAGNADYPISGGIIAETLGEMKTESELNFANRRKTEIDAMRSFLLNHYLQSSFLIRSFASLPPRDYEGYATSLLEFPERGTSGAFSFLSSPAAPNLID